MPKASFLQPSFSAGEFSPNLFGRTDVERFKTGLATCLNYIPTVQGPLLRRPGTKYVANAKDAAKPPLLIPFQFSQTQTYIIEAGDRYFRFYSDGGQLVTPSVGSSQVYVGSSFYYHPVYNPPNIAQGLALYGITNGQKSDFFYSLDSGSSLAQGAIVEFQTPYAHQDLSLLKWSQKEDTLYLTHPKYPTYKLIRRGNTYWDLVQVLFLDGPYLPLNSHSFTGDSVRSQMEISAPFGTTAAKPSDGQQVTVSVGSSSLITALANNGGVTRVTAPNHGFQTNDLVFISTSVGSGAASVINNAAFGTPGGAYDWRITRVDANTFDISSLAWAGGSYTGSGRVYGALFDSTDAGRYIALNSGGTRYWGRVQDNAGNLTRGQVVVGLSTHPADNLAFTSQTWQLGVWSNSSHAVASCFHQDRLALDGGLDYPQQINLSETGIYESFAPSNSSYIVADNNAVQFTVSSQELNAIQWMASEAQGLLAGTFASEWTITPSNQAAALTPTNINAQESSFFGSDTVSPVKAGNATLYVQRAKRKLREMNYFFQVGTFRSTDLTELSDHITAPQVTQLAVAKDLHPVVWGVRSDGELLSMSYNRDDTTLKVGWARHELGGRSDSSGTKPIIKNIAVITASNASYDQLWMTSQRYINGTSVVAIEYMAAHWENIQAQEDAYYLDCGITFDNPKLISAVTNAAACVVTCTAHGMSSGQTVKINEVVGINKSSVDADGNQTITNLLNTNTFLIGTTSVNAFNILNFDQTPVDSSAYDIYISGGKARRLISSISGLTWLKTEVVNVLADGGIHGTTVVNSAGVLTLSYPAAKVQIGYGYNSDAQTLRHDIGSGDGTAIGSMRRVGRASFMVQNVADLSIGASFTRLIPLYLNQSDVQQSDEATPLFSGIIREGLESTYDFEGQVCFRQSSPLPGVIQSITLFVEENDV